MSWKGVLGDRVRKKERKGFGFRNWFVISLFYCYCYLLFFFLIGNRSHGCQLVLGKWRWQLTGASFRGYLVSGQIFPCSSGKWSKARVRSLEAISPSFWHTHLHVQVYWSLVVCFSHSPLLFLTFLKIWIHFWSLYSAKVLNCAFCQGPEGTKRPPWPSVPRPLPLLMAQDTILAQPKAISPWPKDMAGVPHPVPVPRCSWVAVWFS